MMHSKHDLARRYLADAMHCGAQAACDEFTIKWCEAHRCSTYELQAALDDDNAATEARVKRFDDEEYGRIVMLDAALERG